MEKKIDAVAMTRRIRDAHYEQLKNVSMEERLRFYRDRARRLHDDLAQAENARNPRSAP